MSQPGDEVTRKVKARENISRMGSRERTWGPCIASRWGQHWCLWPERTFVGTGALESTPKTNMERPNGADSSLSHSQSSGVMEWLH